jgi:hypothetical protein
MRTRVRHVSGGRSRDGSQAGRSERVDAALREFVSAEVVALLGRFTQERAPGGLGVEGVPQTFDALGRGAVAALLLVPGALEDRSSWFGLPPFHVLADGDALPPADWGVALRAPMVDVAVRAALGTRAQIWLIPDGLPGTPADGIGAFLRFR